MMVSGLGGAGSDESKSVARDWQNREFIESLQQSILQMITFLNEFGGCSAFRSGTTIYGFNKSSTGSIFHSLSLHTYRNFLEKLQWNLLTKKRSH